MMKLFVYDHCPYCVRARMIFGLKKIPVELVILANDDDITPTKLIGQKMVPILEKNEGSYMPESLDIVHYIDQHYGSMPIIASTTSVAIQNIIKSIQQIDYKLLYPRFIQIGLPEFVTKSAKDYFEQKKSQRSGPFNECLLNTTDLIKHIEQPLNELEDLLITTHNCNEQLSIDDICLFPVLRNLTCIKGLTFPTKVKKYIESMAKQSNIDLYFDRAM